LANEIDPRLRSALRNASCVVFLCSGNMVRSAFAELVTPCIIGTSGKTFVVDDIGIANYFSDVGI
jgi:protein-tyrosine-phosphatase